MQANVLKFRWVHPFRNGRDGERQTDFGSAKCRSNLVVHGLDPWEPFGKQFDQRFVLPAIKNKARARRLYGSGVDPDLIFAIPIFSPDDESEVFADDIQPRASYFQSI